MRFQTDGRTDSRHRLSTHFTGTARGSPGAQISVAKLVRVLTGTSLWNAKLRAYLENHANLPLRPSKPPALTSTQIYVQTALAPPNRE